MLVGATLIWAGGTITAGLIQTSTVSVQVGILVALSVSVGYVLARVGVIISQSTDRARMIGMRAALSAGGSEPMRVRPSATMP